VSLLFPPSVGAEPRVARTDPDLSLASRSYTHGFNLPALGALVVSIPPNLPGMINALNSSVDIGNAKYICASLSSSSRRRASAHSLACPSQTAWPTSLRFSSPDAPTSACLRCARSPYLLPPTTRLTWASAYRPQLFPNRDSLIAEAVLAEDVLEGRVPGYEHLARREFRPQEGSITPSDEKLDGDAMVGSV